MSRFLIMRLIVPPVHARPAPALSARVSLFSSRRLRVNMAPQPKKRPPSVRGRQRHPRATAQASPGRGLFL
eukprot:5829166-Prymnesium_polylepis.1